MINCKYCGDEVKTIGTIFYEVDGNFYHDSCYHKTMYEKECLKVAILIETIKELEKKNKKLLINDLEYAIETLSELNAEPNKSQSV
jgi:hypothetical protein